MITLEKAKKALEAAEKKAKELNVSVCIIIVDEHGSIIAAGRMDNAIPISPKFAYAKAFTSASLGIENHKLEAYEEQGKPYFGLNAIFGGELTSIAGGVPVMMNGKLVGGIGVGGSMDVGQDAQCATEARKVLEAL